MKIDGCGQGKTQRGMYSRAHGKWAGPIEYKLSRGEGGLLTGLRHGSPAHRYLTVPSPRSKGGFRPLFGTAPMRTSTPEAFRRGEGDIYRPFGTGTLNRTTSGVEARGKTVWNRCQTGLLPMLRPDFGTASPARGLSVASWRGEAVIYWLFVHKMPLFHGR